MIQLNHITLAFGGRFIFKDLTWTLKQNLSIGLIGPNGAGKSTMLRVLAGRQKYDEGTIAVTGSATIGFLEQDVQEMPTDRSVKEEAMLAFTHVMKLQEREVEIMGLVEQEEDHESDRYASLLTELGNIQNQLVAHEAHRIESKSEAVLTGLGFEPKDLDRPLKSFSGGWRMRVALAKLLLQNPTFLLLDEPTNHLDIDSIDWLEKYLRDYAGTVVIVSHDRYFLDRMVTTTVELYNGQLTEYAGNYSYYLEEREERRALQKAAYENQQKSIAETQRFIERFRYKATKAKQVQSRVKMLEKLERIPPPPTDQASIHIRFPMPERSGRVVLELSEFSKHYVTEEGRLDVFEKSRGLIIERGDKIALVGRNGAGKSTLARMINGTEPFEGERKLGYKVERTFFAQHQADTLDLNDTILQSMQAISKGQTETELRNILGAFLFTGDDVFKPIRVLSGGEKSRVALARTLLVPANFMILDEPTNHLDMQSINVLIEALQQYAGSFVVVSHDRHFLDQIVNKVWRAEDGEVREYLGNYTEYMWQVEHGTASKVVSSPKASKATSSQSNKKEPEKKKSSGPKTKEQKRREAEERNNRFQQMKAKSGLKDPKLNSLSKLKSEHKSLEQEIEIKEATVVDIETQLADPEVYQDAERSNQLMKDYQAHKSELEKLYEKWEKMSELLAEV